MENGATADTKRLAHDLGGLICTEIQTSPIDHLGYHAAYIQRAGIDRRAAEADDISACGTQIDRTAKSGERSPAPVPRQPVAGRPTEVQYRGE